jgi:arylsulfatase A-like enzyme
MGILDNTIIVFTTDHGTHLGEEKCVQKTPSLLNRCVTHIPLIIRHPDKKYAGQRVNGLVSALDFMPTFLRILGIDDYKNMDGKNMWDLVTGEEICLHDNVYTVFKNFGAIHNANWHYFQCIRGKDATRETESWHKNPGVSPCLYDLKNDPEQTKNVIKEHPEIARKLRSQLQEHLGIEIPKIAL